MTYSTAGLTEDQLQVLKFSGAVMKRWAFYLAGGTALTLYLKHRRSVDLDWFTQKPLQDPMVFAQNLRDAAVSFSTAGTGPGTLHGTIEGVRVSFFEYRYALLQPLNHWSEFDISLASLDDLAAMKLSAIAQRGSKKDFLDVYALCRPHRPLLELLSSYRQNLEWKISVRSYTGWFISTMPTRNPTRLCSGMCPGTRLKMSSAIGSSKYRHEKSISPFKTRPVPDQPKGKFRNRHHGAGLYRPGFGDGIDAELRYIMCKPSQDLPLPGIDDFPKFAPHAAPSIVTIVTNGLVTN